MIEPSMLSGKSLPLLLQPVLKSCVYLNLMQRKLLVEKRVVLDDIPNADRKSDRLLAMLPPRSATIQRDENSSVASKMRTSRSEYNMSRSRSSVITCSVGSQPATARLATSISVSNNLSSGSGHMPAAGHPAQGDAVGSWKVHDINEVREPKNVGSFHEVGGVRANEQTCVATSSLGRVNSASQQTGTGSMAGRQVGTERTRNDRDRHRRGVAANADSTESVGHDARPRSVPPKLSHHPLQVHDEHGTDSMGAQYEPGNVRHLVQTFQSAFRPVTAPGRGGAAADQTSVRADEASAQRDRLQTADQQYHRQTGAETAARDRRWPNSQLRHVRGAVVPRTDTAAANVCVVRPATGRTLPQPPTPDRSQSPRASSNPSTSTAQELHDQPEQSNTRSSSNKASKLWQAYGCL